MSSLSNPMTGILSLSKALGGECLNNALLLQESPQKERLERWSDDLSCALFGLANVVTIMFYTLEATTKGMVEGGKIARPPWLGFAVHVSNSITAWLDLFLAKQRSFSKRSSRLSLVLIAVYTLWILISSHFNGSFPYPFLNKLPWPQVRSSSTRSKYFLPFFCPASVLLFPPWLEEQRSMSQRWRNWASSEFQKGRMNRKEAIVSVCLGCFFIFSCSEMAILVQKICWEVCSSQNPSRIKVAPFHCVAKGRSGQ